MTFLRSTSGTDPVSSLWVLDAVTGAERLVADPRAMLEGGEEELSLAERVRRERSREGGAGIVEYTKNRDGRVVAFALSGRLFVAALPEPWLHSGGASRAKAADAGTTRELPAQTPVADPHPDPDGRRVAYVSAGTLRVIDVDGSDDRALVAPDGPAVGWGLAEFIAAEEMLRHRGFWWAPDGSRLLVARVDESRVQRWWVSNPADPAAEPTAHAYPAAGTPNADVSLAIVSLAGSRVDVDWDRQAYEYLVAAGWHNNIAFAMVQSRDQRTTRLLSVDPDTGETAVLQEETDPYWVEVVVGVPAWCGERLATVADRDGWRRLLLDGRPVSPDGLQVRAVRSADDSGVLFTASTDPAEIHLWHCSPDAALIQLTEGRGVHDGASAAGTLLVTAARLGASVSTTEVCRVPLNAPAALPRSRVVIASYAQRPVLEPRVELLRVTDRQIPLALLLPRDYEPRSGPLPVLMDPYGGPHTQRVLATTAAYLPSQWFADQGFAVVVVDGAGTPGRGYAVERAISGDFSTPVLADQVDALQALAATRPELDLSRVGIRGWSFGGYLAAMAVLRRPDVFHAAVAGAPLIDPRLYDTHYTERYLGDPDAASSAYAHSSLLPDASALTRPLMLLHGLADDNVVAAHTLRLSSSLLAAGRPHTVLPLSGVTHMTPQEDVAENILLLQLDFLRTALNSPPTTHTRSPHRPGALGVG